MLISCFSKTRSRGLDATQVGSAKSGFFLGAGGEQDFYGRFSGFALEADRTAKLLDETKGDAEAKAH